MINRKHSRQILDSSSDLASGCFMLDELANEFRAKWYDAILMRGERPAISNFLERVADRDKQELLRRLVVIDVDR